MPLNKETEMATRVQILDEAEFHIVLMTLGKVCIYFLSNYK